MPYITSQNAAITAERNWLISKQYQNRWSPSERTRLKEIASRYKVKWSGNTRHIPWNSLLERVDIIPNSMVATMAAAESGWGTSKLARVNNNLFGMKCGGGNCRGAMMGYSQFDSVEESVMETSVAESEEQSSGETVARPEELRLLEALLFASTEPLEESALAKRMPEGVDDVVVNDLASESAPGFFLLALEAARGWRMDAGDLRLFARIDNALDQSYIGSVIVNEGNGRFYEPGPGRTFLLGAQWQWGH